MVEVLERVFPYLGGICAMDYTKTDENDWCTNDAS